MNFSTVKLSEKEGIKRVRHETNNIYYETPLTNAQNQA